MLTNNYLALKDFAEKSGYSYTSGQYVTDIGLRNLDGSSVSILYGTGNGSLIPAAASNFKLRTNLGCLIGSGNREESQTDYALQTNISVPISVTISTGADSGKLYTYVNISGNNTSGGVLSINEIGIYKTIYYRTNQYDTTNILLIRTVLPSPVVVEQGAPFNLLYSWIEE